MVFDSTGKQIQNTLDVSQLSPLDGLLSMYMVSRDGSTSSSWNFYPLRYFSGEPGNYTCKCDYFRNYSSNKGWISFEFRPGTIINENDFTNSLNIPFKKSESSGFITLVASGDRSLHSVGYIDIFYQGTKLFRIDNVYD